eukprot:2174565-Rhodomonas_salina.2
MLHRMCSAEIGGSGTKRDKEGSCGTERGVVAQGGGLQRGAGRDRHRGHARPSVWSRLSSDGHVTLDSGHVTPDSGHVPG